MQADFYFADRQSVFYSPRKVVLSVGASKTVGAEVKAPPARRDPVIVTVTIRACSRRAWSKRSGIDPGPRG